MSSEAELISLSELIEQIKHDLLTKPVSDDGTPLFLIDGIEITAQVVAKREKAEGGKAGLSLSVLGFGADAGVDTKTSVGAQLTQTVSVKLTPLLERADYLARLEPEQRERLEAAYAAGVVRGPDDDAGPIA